MNTNELSAPLDFSNHTFRASSNGKLVGGGKGKSPLEKYADAEIRILQLEDLIKNEKNTATKRYTNNCEELSQLKNNIVYLRDHKEDIILSETATSYLEEIYVEKRYGIKKNIFGKYLDNGKAKENDSIFLLRKFDDELYKKCELPRQKNEFIEGECDILYPTFEPEEVIDVKSSWDAFTFQNHAAEYHESNNEIKSLIYEYQGISYCVLYNVQKFTLAYCLVNMPNELISDELKRMLWTIGTGKEDSKEYKDACDEYIKSVNYDHIPDKAKVIKFTVNFDQAKYDLLVKKIIASRKWLNEYAIKEWERETGKKWIIEEISHKVIDATYEDEKTNFVNAQFIDSDSKFICASCEFPVELDENSKYECGKCGYTTIEAGEKIEETGFYDNIHTEDGQKIEPEIAKGLITGDWNDVSDNQEEINSENYDASLMTDEEIVKESDLPINVHFENDENDNTKVIFYETIKENTDTETENTVSDPIIELINSLQDKQACIDFYLEKGSDYWTENKNYYQELDKKKNSFIVEATIPSKPQPKPIPVKTDSVKSPIVTFVAPKQENIEGDIEKINEFREKMLTFTTVKEVRDFYVDLENRPIIDRNADFRKEYELHGKSIAQKAVEYSKKKIQDELNS